MGAYHNALREEGTRKDLITALEKAWAEIDAARLDGAAVAWKSVISLIDSGTPVEGIRAIAEYNIQGLEK